MYGLAAISANNGWAMALAGALIVIAGLAVLAAVISQLQKIAGFIENRRTSAGSMDTAVAVETSPRSEEPVCELDSAEDIYRPLAQELSDTFDLAELYDLAKRNDLPHVHLSIRSLRQCGIIISAGEGRFCWKS